MARVPFGKLAFAIRLVSSGMGSSGWACNDILLLLDGFMKLFFTTVSLYSILFPFSCPLVRTKFPSRVTHTPQPCEAEEDSGALTRYLLRNYYATIGKYS